MNRIVPAVCMAAALAGCATNPKDIAPAYVSTSGYERMSCTELAAEAEVVSSRAIAASGTQQQNASRDAAMTTVGVVLFWPALFFMKGDGAQAAEVSRLKGEMEALETVSRRKNCNITFAAG